MRFLRNKKGAVFVWALCFFCMVVYSIVWFAAGLAFEMYIEAIEDIHTFESPMDTTIDLIKAVFAWHPILMIIGLIVIAFVQSQRREEVTGPYPYY